MKGSSLAELRKMSDDELVEEHNHRAEHTFLPATYFLDELQRRALENHNCIMTRLTCWITAMTAVMLLATVVNVVLLVILTG